MCVFLMHYKYLCYLIVQYIYLTILFFYTKYVFRETALVEVVPSDQDKLNFDTLLHTIFFQNDNGLSCCILAKEIFYSICTID